MTFDYAQTFETKEEATCNCPFKFKVIRYNKEFADHLDAVQDEPSTYHEGYTCKDCHKPTSFYVQECEYCPEAKCFYYGRPPAPGFKDFMKCLNCKREGK